MLALLVSVQVDHTSVAIGAPLRPNKRAQTNQIYLCPCSNRIEKGYHSLKSAREYLSHFSLPCRCQGGAHHTFAPPSGPKNEPKYTKTNKICLCLYSTSHQEASYGTLFFPLLQPHPLPHPYPFPLSTLPLPPPPLSHSPPPLLLIAAEVEVSAFPPLVGG